MRMAGGGAALSRVSSRGRLAAPYPTVPYSTVPYCALPYSRNIRQSISYPVSLKESQGERKPLLETGENVENSVENLLQGAQAAAGGRGGAWGSADSGRVRVRQGLLVGHSPARAFGRCGCGGRFWLARCGGRAVRDAGAAQGALTDFLTERKNS